MDRWPQGIFGIVKEPSDPVLWMMQFPLIRAFGRRPAHQSAQQLVCQDNYGRKAPVGTLVLLLWLGIISNKFSTNASNVLSYLISFLNLSSLQFFQYCLLSIPPPPPLPPPSVGGSTPRSSITSHQLYMWYWTGFLWGRLNMESGVLLQDLKDLGHPSVASKILIMCFHPDSCHFITSSPHLWDSLHCHELGHLHQQHVELFCQQVLNIVAIFRPNV